MISLIFARAKNGVIGKNNQLPWHLPEDFQWFKQHTIDRPVIMGFNTFLSIVASIGKPLPKRDNFVLTSKPREEIILALRKATKSKFPDLDLEKLLSSIVICRYFSNAVHRAEMLCSEVFVIGGAKVYEEALLMADKLYITEVLQDFEGDTYFPKFDPKNWVLSADEEQNTVRTHNGIPYMFAVYHNARGHALAAKNLLRN